MTPNCRLKEITFSNYALNLTCSCNVLAASRCTFSFRCSISDRRLREARYCIGIMVLPSGLREGSILYSFHHDYRLYNSKAAYLGTGLRPSSRQASSDIHLTQHGLLRNYTCGPSLIIYLWDTTSVGEENEAFFIRTWKPFSSRRILKTSRESPNRTISSSGGLGLLQMISELELSDVPAKRLSPEGGEHEAVCHQGRWTPKRGGLGAPTSIGGGNECQWGRWALKGGGLWDPHIGWGEERSILYQGGNISLVDVF